MRVKFGNHIDWCKRVRRSEGSRFLLITTANSDVYTVDCTSETMAVELYNKALIDGYIDISNFNYSN